MSMNISNISSLNIRGSDCRCIISLVSQNEAINFMQNVDLSIKIQNFIKHKKIDTEI